jgi:PAS domain-containing protein
MALAQTTGTHSAIARFCSAASHFTQGGSVFNAVALVVTDLAGNVRYMNYAASQMLKLTREETRGLF